MEAFCVALKPFFLFVTYTQPYSGRTWLEFSQAETMQIACFVHISRHEGNHALCAALHQSFHHFEFNVTAFLFFCQALKNRTCAGPGPPQWWHLP
jgi:hypothetical protein